jgi:hypothetical protein
LKPALTEFMRRTQARNPSAENSHCLPHSDILRSVGELRPWQEFVSPATTTQPVMGLSD